MRRRIAVLLPIALSITLFAVGCGDAGIRSPMADNDGPEAIEVGNKAFSAEMYNTATNAYTIAGESMPDRSEPIYNTANTLYRQQRFREAIDLYDQILGGQNLELSDRTTFNVGNALYGAGEHEQAIEMYKQALRNNPDDLDAKHNLELALAHMPQPPQPEQPPDSSQEQPTPEPSPQEQQQQEQQGQPQEQAEDQDAQQSDEESEGEPQEGEEEGDPQEGDSESEPTEPNDEPSEPGAGDQPLEEIVPPSGLTEEQARRLLEMVGENAEPLRNAIQIRRSLPGNPPAQEW